MAGNLIITGFERALLGFRDSNGIATGVQSTLSNGSTSGAYVAKLVRTASFETLAPTNLNVEGGDILYTIVQYGNAKTMPFSLILSNNDRTLVEMISGSQSNTTNAQHTVVSDNPNRSSPRTLWLGLQSRAEDVDSGDQYYVTKFFPACSMRIRRAGPGFQALSDTVINVTPKMVSKALTGQVFGTSGLNMNLQDDKTDNYDYITARPIHAVSFRQDNSATTFNTIYKPISTTITLNNTPNAFFINAVATALSSLTLAGLATLAAAGTAAIADLLLHETDYVPV